ncbi:MAG TPA: tetratricopeptide repeat protein [Candidatus Acidoferrales bacterium]|nr:tetratricopeptide repeat protein [Candidatus Acidoferrales bacterium]
MQRKSHVWFLVAVVLTSCAAGVGCDKLRARDRLNKGVNAYKNGQFDQAIEYFKEAKDLDPTLTNAQLYLATAYASLYIPGAPSQDNIRNGEQAVAEFKAILDADPNNLAAIDGIGSILYNMGGSPFDAAKLNESKSYHEKHIQIKPDDPEPYYWVGVIDWSLAFRANKDLRDAYNKTAKKPIKEGDPLPPAVAKDFAAKYGSVVDDGVASLQKAQTLRSEYDDAMAYLNLLYRQKADMETTTDARNQDLQTADDLVERVKAIKQKKANITPSS